MDSCKLILEVPKLRHQLYGSLVRSSVPSPVSISKAVMMDLRSECLHFLAKPVEGLCLRSLPSSQQSLLVTSLRCLQLRFPGLQPPSEILRLQHGEPYRFL